MISEELYKKAVTCWGEVSQMDLLVEECAELIQAVQKFNHRHGSYYDVTEKLADVEIMCEQMRVIFNPDRIDEIKKQKLEWLAELLDTE